MEKADELMQLQRRIDDLRRCIEEQQRRVAEEASWPHVSGEVLELLTSTMAELEMRRDVLLKH
jgi:hypothetical protein